MPLSAGVTETKSGNDFIKNKNAPVILCDFTQSFQKSRFWKNDAHIGGHRLDNEGRDLLSAGFK